MATTLKPWALGTDTSACMARQNKANKAHPRVQQEYTKSRIRKEHPGICEYLNFAVYQGGLLTIWLKRNFILIKAKVAQVILISDIFEVLLKEKIN